MNPHSKFPSASLPPAVGSALGPQRGEVWIHESHGPVTIIKAWNRNECVCEIHSRKAAGDTRRSILKNKYMRKSA
jgi:hypothetical protein